jgi:hypothetical protein
MSGAVKRLLGISWEKCLAVSATTVNKVCRKSGRMNVNAQRSQGKSIPELLCKGLFFNRMLVGYRESLNLPHSVSRGRNLEWIRHR